MLSIQYVYERVILFYRLSLKAGAKVQLYFNLASFILKKIIYFSLLKNLLNLSTNLHYLFRVLRTAKVNQTFISGKLFLKKFNTFQLNLYLNILMNYCFIAGAKVACFFFLTNLFIVIFYSFFILYLALWLSVLYNTKYF